MKIMLATDNGKENRYYCIEAIIDRFRGSEVFDEARLRHNLKALDEETLFNMYYNGNGPSRSSGCTVKAQVSDRVRQTLRH